MVFGAYTNLCYLINIRVRLMKSIKHESRIVKADFDVLTQKLEYLNIRPLFDLVFDPK